MSDMNLDVVPEESVVDGPADYEANDSVPADEPAETPTEEEAGPVSLDDPVDGPETEEVEADEAETGEGEETGIDEAPEKVEFNFGGNKLEIEKGSMPEELVKKMQDFSSDIYADYTNKSKSNAEQAKALKAGHESVMKMTTLNGEALQAYSQGLQVKSEIEQLSQVNLQELWQSNPDQARRVSDTLSAKQAEFQNIVNVVDQHEQGLSQLQHEQRVQQKEEGLKMLDSKFKDFSTKTAPELVEHVVANYGMSKEEAGEWAGNPMMTEMAYKAMLYDKMQAAKAPKVPTPKAKAKPMKAMRSKGNAQGSTDPNKMGFAELGKLLDIK